MTFCWPQHRVRWKLTHFVDFLSELTFELKCEFSSSCQYYPTLQTTVFIFFFFHLIVIFFQPISKLQMSDEKEIFQKVSGSVKICMKNRQPLPLWPGKPDHCLFNTFIIWLNQMLWSQKAKTDKYGGQRHVTPSVESPFLISFLSTVSEALLALMRKKISTESMENQSNHLKIYHPFSLSLSAWMFYFQEEV